MFGGNLPRRFSGGNLAYTQSLFHPMSSGNSNSIESVVSNLAISSESGEGSHSAGDAFVDGNSTAQEKKWSRARTSFASHDLKRGVNQHINWKNLQRLNEGYGEDGRKTDLRWRNIRADIELFGNLLELSDTEIEEAKRLLKSIDFSSNKTGGKSYEHFILGALTLIRDRRLSQSERNPAELMERRLQNHENWNELLDSANSGSNAVRKARQKIREQL